jgi:hydrogenase maturation protein HypF
MEFEFQVDPSVRDAYPVELGPPEASWAMGTWAPPPLVVDWAPVVDALLDEVDAGTPIGVIAARFHNTLADMIVMAATRLREPRVVLTGGCFQNRYLTEQAVAGLDAAGVRPYWHQRLPPNDGGISAGQIAAWLRAHAAAATVAGRTDGSADTMPRLATAAVR